MSNSHDVPIIPPIADPADKRKRRMTARWRYTNQLNARASTGPRTPGGKARVARNALAHGLSLPVLSDPAVAPEVEDLARKIAQSVVGRRLDDARHELACRVAEAIIDLRRVRTAKLPLFAKMEADPDSAKPLEQLCRLARYEGRACEHRRRAVRAFYASLVEGFAAVVRRHNKAIREVVNPSKKRLR